MGKALMGALLVLLCASLVQPVLAASAAVGVVLLHGKWGMPQSLAPLARQLESNGYWVRNVETAWSRRRLYDVDYPAGLKEIEQQVRQLRAQGAKRVFVAGQSLGANAAVAYASSGFDLDGCVVISPGHFPEAEMGKALHASVERAKQMVALGRGAESASFEDINQGERRWLTLAAATYLSYFDPEGLGAITKNIQKIAKPMPLLLVIGTGDRFYPGSQALFNSAPAHPASRYLALDGDHFGLANLAAGHVFKWIEAVAQ